MRTPSEILKLYLDTIAHLSGAETVSLYVPDPLGDGGRAILLKSGAGPAVPELTDEASARQLAQTTETSDGHPTSLSAFVASSKPSSSSQGILLPLNGMNENSSATAWLGLRNANTEQPPQNLIETESVSQWWKSVIDLGNALTRDIMRVSGVLNDPVSGLPGRAEFFQTVEEELTSSNGKKATSIVTFSPDNFATVNELYGLKLGDQVVRQAAQLLQSLLRPTDYVVRYGGVVFAALLPDTDAETASELSGNVRNELEKADYLNGEVRLRFSAGVTSHAANAQLSASAPLELIQRANHALNGAKRAGGGRVSSWKPDPSADTTAGDELTGIFTGTMGKDYRNMVLLWETLGLMAESSDLEGLTTKVLGCIYNAFRPERVGLFISEKRGDPVSLLSGYIHSKTGDQPAVKETKSAQDFGISEAEKALINNAVSAQIVVGSQVPGVDESTHGLEHPTLAVPLVTRDNCLGCLYLDRSQGLLGLDVSDIHFLKVFGNHIAVAIDRGILAKEEAARRERKRLKLLGEVHELRQALGHAKLVHTSPQMEQVLSIARQVAPTDATILVTGESGTGKGVLARTIHKLSQRSNKSLVLVDCSAITTSLIESELFGHERGAFTGADRKTIGRLAEADGGTVFLDEIGELPLEVQSKLLTFVQDKQLMAVGSNRTRTVDVRIIAATNRELAEEVESGRFRRDLYYRLNVVTVELPPLRVRPDDILLLARHFIERFNVQYQKSARGLTGAAEGALAAHHWPGNIRELQNRVMRAVILSQSEMIGPLELGFDSVAPAHQTTTLPGGGLSTGATPTNVIPPDPWSDLDAKLGSLIQQVDINSGHQPPPFGKWLEEDLIEAAFEKIGGVHRRGAAVLGIPETTFRRKMKQIKARSLIGPMPRTPEWRELNDVFERLVEQKNESADDYLVRSRDSLLTHVLNRFGDKVSMSAALMGVTEPTISRWRTKLQNRQAQA